MTHLRGHLPPEIPITQEAAELSGYFVDEQQKLTLPWEILVELYWRVKRLTARVEFSVAVTIPEATGDGGQYSPTEPYVWTPATVNAPAISRTWTHEEIANHKSVDSARWGYREVGVDENDQPILEAEIIDESFFPSPFSGWSAGSELFSNNPVQFSQSFTFTDAPFEEEVNNEQIEEGAEAQTSVRIDMPTSVLEIDFGSCYRTGNAGTVQASFRAQCVIQALRRLRLITQSGPAPGTVLSTNEYQEYNAGFFTSGAPGETPVLVAPLELRWGGTTIDLGEQWRIYSATGLSVDGIEISDIKVIFEVEEFYTYGGIYAPDTGERV